MPNLPPALAQRTVAASARSAGRAAQPTMPWKRSVGQRALADFTRSLGVLLASGVRLTPALTSSLEGTRDERLKRVVRDVKRRVERGEAFSSALARHGAVFSSLYVGLVRAGEESGALAETLRQTSTFLEKQYTLVRKVRGALAYPLLVLLVAGGATAFMLAFVVPAFADLFREFGETLPLPTRVLLALSHALTGFWWLWLPLIVLFGWLCAKAVQVPVVRERLETMALHLPVFGELVSAALSARLCRTLGTLLGHGVRLADALPLAARTLPFARYRRAVLRLRRLVVAGRGLGEAARQVGEIAPLVVQVVAVGEETARLDALLLDAAAHYEAEVESRLGVVLSLLEPLLILLVGLVLGAILVALYLPMFDLMNVVE